MSKSKQRKGGARLAKTTKTAKSTKTAKTTKSAKTAQTTKPAKSTGTANTAKAAHVQKEQKVHGRRKKLRLAVILTLAILLALAATAFAVHQALVKRPEIPDIIFKQDKSDLTVDGVDPGGDRKKDFFTFLIIGRDTGGGGNTDTILLAAYDIPNQQLNVMSIPRDTMVNVPWDMKKINSVYNYYGGGDKGIEALYKEVSQLVGFIPDFEVVIEWEAVGKLVEAIGGVWFDVPRNMNYDDPDQNLHIHINKGYQQLDGEDAMGVIRWRENNDGSGYPMGDIGRIETQQAFLKAVIQQCLKIENATKIQTFADIFSENVLTDLTVGNLIWFAEQAIFGGLKMENVNFITMPGDYSAQAWSRTYRNYQSYVLPDGTELLKVVNENFNPYLDDRTAMGLDIMSINADGTLSSSTGVVEDAQAAGKPQGNTAPSQSASSTPAPSVTRDPVPTSRPSATEPPDIPPVPVTDPPSATENPEPSPEAPPEPSGGGGEGEDPPEEPSAPPSEETVPPAPPPSYEETAQAEMP